MKRFLQYLKEKRSYIFLVIVMNVIYYVCFFLYSLPFDAVIYPSLLSFLLLCMILCYKFHKSEVLHKELDKIDHYLKIPSLFLIEEKSDIQRDYERILKLLLEEKSMQEHKKDTSYAEMMDYYTVWVHQIKTPIASMKLALEEEDSDFARNIRSDLFRIEQYVDMVLTYLRLDSDSSDYILAPYNLDDIIKSSVKKFAYEFIKRKIKLDYQLTNLTVLTDEKWLSFVIEQLLSNALKYTYHGEIHVYLSSERVLCIEDTGIGIAPDDLPRIFERGYTGLTGRKDKKASGLGLYLCKQICNRLSHSLWAESEISKGTKMFLSFPEGELEIE